MSMKLAHFVLIINLIGFYSVPSIECAAIRLASLRNGLPSPLLNYVIVKTNLPSGYARRLQQPSSDFMDFQSEDATSDGDYNVFTPYMRDPVPEENDYASVMSKVKWLQALQPTESSTSLSNEGGLITSVPIKGSYYDRSVEAPPIRKRTALAAVAPINEKLAGFLATYKNDPKANPNMAKDMADYMRRLNEFYQLYGRVRYGKRSILQGEIE